VSDNYRILFERSADAVLIIEGEAFVDCNQAAVDMLRCKDKRQVLSAHPSRLSPERQPDGQSSFEKANEMIGLAFERGSHRFEWEHLRFDGQAFPVEVLLTAMRIGEQDSLHVVWRDISERKQLEDELRHAHKLEAIGKLAGGVAHDFNNLLVSILCNSDLLMRRLGGDEDSRLLAREIKLAGERAAELTQQLLAFSRKQVLEPKVIDLNATVQEVQRMLGRLIGEDVRLESHLSPEPLWILADPGQIQQVILNLASNARDAMIGGGMLVLITEFDGTEEDHPLAVLEMRDSGIGMSPETLSRAFDPFFTTKADRGGTGLGLSTAYGIVTQSGGEIRIESEPGAGTLMRLAFPSAPAPKSAPISSSRVRLRPAIGGIERILLAEDEPGVARLMLRVLEGAGYTVTHAKDGIEAIELWSVQESYQLLLSDVILPRIGGPELAQRLRKQQPGLKVLFASGYTNEALSERNILSEGVEFLRKPFSAAALLKRVREVLDR